MLSNQHGLINYGPCYWLGMPSNKFTNEEHSFMYNLIISEIISSEKLFLLEKNNKCT